MASTRPIGWPPSIESSEDAIIDKCLLDGTITKTPERFGAGRIFGYEAEEIIGKPVTILIPPELWPEEKEILERLCKGERIDHFETRRVRKDGQAIFVSLTISPIRDKAGKITGISKIARDVTEQKRLLETRRPGARGDHRGTAFP